MCERVFLLLKIAFSPHLISQSPPSTVAIIKTRINCLRNNKIFYHHLSHFAHCYYRFTLYSNIHSHIFPICIFFEATVKMATQKMEEVKEQHVIRLTGVPYGFFEKEMQGYFSQFGHVKRVRVVRNKRGHHNGIAFVEFKNAEVAKIVAKTMDNYLLAEKRLRCRVLEQERVPNSIKRGKLFAKIVKPGENHLKHAKERFKLKTPEHVEYQRTRFVETLRARMEKIRERGINYEFNFEEKLRKFLECKRETTEEDGMEEGEEVGKIGKGEAVDMKLMGGGGGGEEMVVENIQGKGA